MNYVERLTLLMERQEKEFSLIQENMNASIRLEIEGG
jgi:hypothetical protein